MQNLGIDGGDVILVGAIAALIIYSVFNRVETRTELRFQSQRDRLDEIAKELQKYQVIAQQVALAGTAGPETLRNINITQKFAEILMHRFSLEELIMMSFALELNGAFDPKTKLTAATTILQITDRQNRLQDVLKYIEKERPDIKI